MISFIKTGKYYIQLKFKKGYCSAKQAIRQDGESINVAKHHRDVACLDLYPNKFTQGWKMVCDDTMNKLSGKRDLEEYYVY